MRPRDHRQTGFGPGLCAALQHLGLPAFCAQKSGGTFGQLAAAHADHDGASGRIGQGVYRSMGNYPAGRQKAGQGVKVLGQANIEDQRRVRRADQAHGLRRGDLSELRHWVHPLAKGSGMRRLGRSLTGRTRTPCRKG